MSKKKRPLTDVFISHSRQDEKLSQKIARLFASYGLNVFMDVPVGESIEDTLWNAINQCRAFVVILPSGDLSSNMAFELGAAKGGEKPIYLIASDLAKTHIPDALVGSQVYPPSRADEIAQQIVTLSDSFKGLGKRIVS